MDLKRAAFVALAVVGVLEATCGGDDSDRLRADLSALQTQIAQPTPAATASADTRLPSGWRRFDYGRFSGAAPSRWNSTVLARDEYLDLAKKGLSVLPVDSRVPQLIDRARPSDFADSVLVFIGGFDGFPNLNVQPCLPSARAATPAEGQDVARVYAAVLGVTVEVAGDVTFDGVDFALFRAAVSKELESYTAMVGLNDCVSVVTLATHLGDAAAVNDLKTFMSMLKIAR